MKRWHGVTRSNVVGTMGENEGCVVVSEGGLVTVCVGRVKVCLCVRCEGVKGQGPGGLCVCERDGKGPGGLCMCV